MRFRFPGLGQVLLNIRASLSLMVHGGGVSLLGRFGFGLLADCREHGVYPWVHPFFLSDPRGCSWLWGSFQVNNGETSCAEEGGYTLHVEVLRRVLGSPAPLRAFRALQGWPGVARIGRSESPTAGKSEGPRRSGGKTQSFSCLHHVLKIERWMVQAQGVSF